MGTLQMLLGSSSFFVITGYFWQLWKRKTTLQGLAVKLGLRALIVFLKLCSKKQRNVFADHKSDHMQGRKETFQIWERRTQCIFPGSAEFIAAAVLFHTSRKKIYRFPEEAQVHVPGTITLSNSWISKGKLKISLCLLIPQVRCRGKS